MMKKALVFMNVLVIMSLVLISCSNKEENTLNNNLEPTTEAEPTPTEEPTVTPEPTPVSEEDYTGKKLVALTFDDGPNTQITPKILDILEEHDVVATFF